MSTTAIYSESFKVRASEVDTSGNITLSSICELFQEVAGNHALLLNFDITDLQKQNLTWVLHRMDIKINSYPVWRQKIKIETWPAAGDALRAYRNYRVLDEHDNELIVCLSYWMMINFKTRRPTRITHEILELKLSDRDHVLLVKSDRIPKMEEPQSQKEITARRADLDMNQHVNNARYLEWMAEVLNEGQLSRTTQVDIVFTRESIAGDIIISKEKSLNDSGTLHQLENQRGEIVAQAVIS